MRRFFLSLFLVFAIPLQSFASVYISSLLPNPAGDDTLGEYIELRNTGCESVDISGYSLSDASQKTYAIPSGTVVASHENIRFIYAMTKIALNNSGDEAVYLKDTPGNIVDEVHYSGTQKDNVVITLSVTDETCAPPEQAGSGSADSISNSGQILSGSVAEQTPLNPPFSGGSGVTETGSGEVLTDSGSDSGSGDTLASSGSGEIFSDSGSIFSDSGSTLSGSEQTGQDLPNSLGQGGTGVTEAGTGNQTPLASPLIGGLDTTETGTLTPLEMYYSDSDGNSRIDTLEIVYPYMLTGGVNTGAIAIYSNTGGLFSHRINTLTGYVIDGSLSGNILILKLLEGDIDKAILKINNTTSSDLRIKSSGDLGFRSIGGQTPESFFLTNSFDDYRKVYNWDVRYKIGDTSSETGVMDSSQAQNDGTVGSGSTEQIPFSGGLDTTGTGITGLGENPPSPLGQGGSGTTGTGVMIFPEIVPVFQNYTNITNSGDVLTCTTTPCRVNFTLEPIFTGTFLEKNFTCHIIFGTGVYDTCNPPQLYPTSSGNIELILTDKLTGISTEKILSVTFDLVPEKASSVAGIPTPENNHAPIASIDMDGKWKKYFTSPEVNLLRCYAFTCAVNFTGEDSYDPDGDDIHFLWQYDHESISTSRDPGSRTFTIGTHTVSLRVIDIYGAVGEVKYTIEVMSPDLIPEEEKVEAIKKTKEKKKKETTTTTKKKTTKKKKKMKPIIFFEAPEVLIQNKNPSNIQIAGNQYICRTKTKTCSINFALTGAQKGYTYEWTFPGQSGSYISKNPRSIAFAAGASDVRLTVRDLAGNILDERVLSIQVRKTTNTRSNAKKKKKTSVKRTKQTPIKAQEKSIVPTQIQPPANEGDNSLLFLMFLSGTGISGYISGKRRRRKEVE